MKNLLILICSLGLCQSVLAKESTQNQNWWEAGLMDETSMADVTQDDKEPPRRGLPRPGRPRPGLPKPRPAKRYECSAIQNALVKNAENYVNQEQSCYRDSDCGVGRVGGFCAGAYHKATLAGYQLWLASSTYKELNEKYRENRCRGPVGRCMFVREARCDQQTRKCVAVRRTRDRGVEPSSLVEDEPLL